ncbi:MAG TPA: magnesium-translocating P-type ATPase [Rhizomicrobium sp.]|nr:magnesium-translocating P-type ATPase [Rhizomicrobium sp.]
MDAYWSEDVDTVLAAISSRPGGLRGGEARERLRTYGPNVVHEAGETTILRLLARQFASPLVLILVFGAVISLFLKQWVDASIVLIVVAGSTLLGFFQEYRASRAVAELRERLALKVRVLRDDNAVTIPASEVVPGDVLLLSAGNLVAADGLVLEAKDFLVSESALTGESFPVEKQAGRVAREASLPQRSNCVFSGTSVRSGTARVVAVRTGRTTEFGAVAERLAAQAPQTEFVRGLRDFGYLLLRIMIAMVLLVVVANTVLGRPTIETMLYAVALAVGLSPELLPAIVSVTLSAGARAMAARGVIVRRLDSIENLGAMDVLCTDKTGTLTQGVISLSGAVDGGGKESAFVREAAFLNASFESGIENPLDQALVGEARAGGLSTEGFAKVDEIPYDFLRKRLTIVVAPRGSDRHRIITKGAFDKVLSLCAFKRADDGTAAALTDSDRKTLGEYARARSELGFRVLGLATKDVDAKARYGHDDEAEMCFAGFLLFFDPPKPQAEQTVRDLEARGISTKIITGDNRYVAAHIGGAVGLDPAALMTGSEIAGLTKEALWSVAERIQIFAEVDPQQKEQIVRALQRAGHAVGYLGDGINDAPALHAADVGISVDQAVDVARQTADIVLLRPDLDVLCSGVANGRRTFANTLKYITIATSSTFGNMVSMALVTPFLPFLPLAAKQILLNNFLSDVPSIAISTDNVDEEQTIAPLRWNIHDVFRFMLYFGLASSLFDGVTFAVLLFLFHAGQHTFQTAWFVVSLLTEIVAVLILRTRRPFLASRPSQLLVALAAAVAVLSLASPFVPLLQRYFDFVALPADLVVGTCVIVIAYVATIELLKRALFRREARGAGA